MIRGLFVCTLAVVLLVGLLPSAHAEETPGVSYSPLAWVYAGALVMNAGVALANGWAVAFDNANRRNGKFGFITGTFTAGLGGTLYLATRGDEDGKTASLLLAGVGLASAALGSLAMWSADTKAGHARIAPVFSPKEREVSLAFTLDF